MTDTLELNEHHKTEMPKTWSGELKALLWLGIPMAATQFAQFFIYTIDILMIGRVGAAEVAAASLGSVIYFMLWMLGAGPVMAVSPMVSQALGADVADRHDARVSVRMALWCVAFMTPVMLVFAFLAEPLALLARQDPEQSAKAGRYILALAAGWPFALGTMILRNYLAAIGKTLVPLVLVLASLALNAGLNALLIFGMFGFPELGLVGAGIASSISYTVGFFLFVVYIQLDKKSAKFRIFHHFWRPHWNRLGEVFKLGWPISLTTLFEGMLFNACVLIVGLIGVLEVAAYQIGLNFAALAFMVPWGLSMAGAVRVGLAKGAENSGAVKRAGILTMVTAVIGIMLFAIPGMVWPENLAQLYMQPGEPDNQQVIALVVTFLPIAAGFMFFDAVQVAANQLLRGLKDVRWPMVATGISYWLVGFPTAFYLAIYTPLGAIGVWYGLLIGLLLASVFLSYRFWRLAWHKA